MRKDGGPAFPVPLPELRAGDWEFHGMTMRDYFAAKAMAAVINAVVVKGIDTTQEDAPAFASVAYIMADAMLAARDRP